MSHHISLRQIKFKRYGAGIISIVNNDNFGEKTLRFLLVSFGILAVLYILILGNMIFAIIERKGYEEDARVLGNAVNELELSYLEAISNIDLELSQSLGFKETEIKFATRKALGSVKLVNNEI